MSYAVLGEVFDPLDVELVNTADEAVSWLADEACDVVVVDQQLDAHWPTAAPPGAFWQWVSAVGAQVPLMRPQ